MFKQIIRSFFIWIADTMAKYQDFHFPEKYTWRWKLDMLFNLYERDTTVLFKKIIKPGMIVMDIGAHIGYYTRLFSKLVGPKGMVYAFEADSNNYKLLQENTSGRKNIRLYNKAITNKVGFIDFYKINGSTGCHSVIASENSEKITVLATTLDGFIRKNNIDRIDIIKIDIEGGETLAFAGMKELFSGEHNFSMVSEWNPAALESAGVFPLGFIRHMQENGFKVLQILPCGNVKLFNGIQSLKFYPTGYVNFLFKKSK